LFLPVVLIDAPHIQRSERIKKPCYVTNYESFRSTAKFPVSQPEPLLL